MDICFICLHSSYRVSRRRLDENCQKGHRVDEKLWEKRFVPSPGDDLSQPRRFSCDNQPPSIDDGKYCIVRHCSYLHSKKQSNKYRHTHHKSMYKLQTKYSNTIPRLCKNNRSLIERGTWKTTIWPYGYRGSLHCQPKQGTALDEKKSGQRI